jgi:hypothetical protein
MTGKSFVNRRRAPISPLFGKEIVGYAQGYQQAKASPPPRGGAYEHPVHRPS